MLPLIEQNRVAIDALCRQYRVRRLELFGSAARGDFDPATSDFDFLVEFEDLGWQGSSDRYFGLLHGLEDLLQRRIDLVEREAVENPIFLEVASRYLAPLYAA
jgi:predicted nucleotidyltransferase